MSRSISHLLPGVPGRAHLTAVRLAALALALAACDRPATTAPGAASLHEAGPAVSVDQGAASDADEERESQAMRPSKFKDAKNDWVVGYVGPRHPDLDVRAGEVSYDGTSYRFYSRFAGPVGLTPGAVYVWGVNRGQGTARFGPLATGVLFDAVISLTVGGDATVRDLLTGTATVLPPASVQRIGKQLEITVPASLLPSTGLPQAHFTANLWPRSGAAGNTAISDFAPDNSNAPVRDIR